MFSLILASGVTINIGGHVWSFSLNFLVYLLMAAIIGSVAEIILGWRAPLGIIGAIVAALVGIWLMTQVIIISGVGDYNIPTTPPIPLIRSLVGAIILIAIWHFLFGGLFRGSSRRSTAAS
ncbi:MAG TPA: hypothetical protein VKV19_12930 [Ktedonobacteraceae bacterium]|jgi:uncharacterized membrane protein YeaQ/YmgE (transglycosylase-associated protein family)|nr:hypothetical protein [Ktedonobacteraceae bacterium]